MRATSILLFLLASISACGEDVTAIVEDLCMTQALPLSGDANGLTVTDVGLEVQQGNGIVIVATATDPQGDDNIRDVLQSVAVFPDAECRGTPTALQDDLVGSGIEETFGTVFTVAAHPALFTEISASVNWPVEVDFVDLDGNRTVGRVLARIIR